MKRILCFLTLVLCVALLSACGCEHLDKNGDGRCDKCVKKMPEATTAAASVTTTTAILPEFPENDEVAAAIEAVIGNAYLGAAFDIGLTAETAPYYHVEGEDGFVAINAEGKLEFIGIRALTTFFSVKGPGGAVVYSGSYNIGSRPLAFAIRTALQNEGKLTVLDVPANLLPELTSLSLDGVEVEYAELSALRYCKGVHTLSLAGQALGDLSCIRALPALRSLDISRAKELSLHDGGLAVVSNLRSLSALEHVSICGSFGVLNRPVFDTLLSMTANNTLTLSVFSDLELSGSSAIGFGETVFFSLEEYIAHYHRHNGVLTPASGFSHAVFSYSSAEHGKDAPINANNLIRLEMYGTPGSYYCTPVTTNGDLSVYLYSYSLRAPRAENSIGISVGGALTLTAASASCSVYGGGWDSPEWTYLIPAAGIKANSLDLYTESAAALYIEGGRGAVGAAGATDNESPDSIDVNGVLICQSKKNGDRGLNGATAVSVTETVTFHTVDGIALRGGRGGRGGDGATGGTGNMLGGGFNGGHGGRGGDGGAALLCGSYQFTSEIGDDARHAFIYNKLIGGAGGNGGSGGAGYALGKTGNAGTGGESGSSVVYQ